MGAEWCRFVVLQLCLMVSIEYSKELLILKFSGLCEMVNVKTKKQSLYNGETSTS